MTKYLSIDYEIMSGRLCLVGTRFTIARLLAKLANGARLSEIADEYRLDLNVCIGALTELTDVLDGVAKLTVRVPDADIAQRNMDIEIARGINNECANRRSECAVKESQKFWKDMDARISDLRDIKDDLVG